MIVQEFLEIRSSLETKFSSLGDTVYEPLDPLQKLTKMNTERTTAFVCILISYILCLGLNFIRNPLLRKIYSTSFGMLLCFYFWGVNAFLQVFMVVSTYLILLFLPRNLASNLMVWYAGGILGSVHYFYFTAPERPVAIFLLLMFTFAKVHMVSWNYYDAGLLDDPEKSKNMTPRERHYAEVLREIPSFFDWIQYFFFVGSATNGPCHEYRDFKEFINFKGAIT